MNSVKRITDIVLFFSFCFLVGSGVMLHSSFVKGMGPQTVFGMDKPEWVSLHLFTGFLMLAAVLVHLVVNRVWIKKVAAMNKKWLAVLLAALGIALIVILACWPTSYGEADPSSPGLGMGQGGGGMAHGKLLGQGSGYGKPNRDVQSSAENSNGG